MKTTALILGVTATATLGGTTAFEATIDGAQSGTSSAATGVLTGEYDSVANTFSFSWDISGPLDGDQTVSHIHRAPLGQSGGVVFGFNNPGGGWPLAGSAVWTDLSTTNVDDLFAGNFYANFHTTAFPGGEIRGQIFVVPAPAGVGLLGFAGLGLARRRR
jgi:hypothetical protein